MDVFFVIVNSTSKLAEGFPDVSGFGKIQYYATLASFPVTGISNIQYVDVAQNHFYKWNGTTYIVDNNPRIIEWINDMLNYGGLGPNQELVASYEPFARPQVEERYILVSQVDTYANTAHPVYTMLKQWQRTYPQTDIVLADKLNAVDVVESQMNETCIPTLVQLKVNALAIYAVMEYLAIDTNAKIDATSISTKAKKNLRVFLKAAKKLKTNDATKVAKKALLTANPLSNPSLTIPEDWAINDFTEEA
jgi:hypothetical protein